MASDESSQWESGHLRSAAVEWVVQTRGPSPTSRDFAECAALLGCDAARLAEWTRDKKHRPECLKTHAPHRPGHTGTEDADNDLTKLAMDAPDVPEGALPSAIQNMILDLAEQDADHVSDEQREELADFLENGGECSPDQIRLVCGILRRGGEKRASEIALALMDWITLETGGWEEVWTRRKTQVALRPGWTWETIPLSARVEGFPVTGSQAVVVRDGPGVPVRVFLYASVDVLRPLRRREKNPVLQLSQLFPVKRLARKAVAQRAAQLMNGLRPAVSWSEFGARCGDTRQYISQLNRAEMERRRAVSGQRGVLRGMRGKTDPRKGKSLKREPSESAA